MSTDLLGDSTSPAPFAALIESFAQQVGLGQHRDGLGLTLEAGAYTATVLPDGSDDEQLVIEVSLGAARAAPAAALALLHRINHVARFRHPWQISLDMDEQIVLHTTRLISRTDASALQALLATGLERAAALDALWQKSLRLTEPAPDVMQAIDLHALRV